MREETLVLDTSTLIDGRLVRLLELLADPRRLLVPSVVHEELEHLARSREESRARRGRRGQANLQRMRTSSLRGEVVIEEARPKRERVDGLHHPGGVDRALVQRVTAMEHGRLVTLDQGLLREAEAAGCAVLDLAAVATAAARKVKVGDRLQLELHSRGREAGQGVAALEDGTRVIVAGGAAHVGATVDVVIDRSHRTRGGVMLFATLAPASPAQGTAAKEPHEEDRDES